jgi:hypothetical protein
MPEFTTQCHFASTCFDTKRSKGKQRNEADGKKVVVGWTGSHSTLHNLEEIEQGSLN